MPQLPDAEEICLNLIRESNCSPPPIDLAAIASLWPRLIVSEADLDREGYLVVLGVQGAEILLRRSDPPNRKRFTFAHELGHWVLSNTQHGIFSLRNEASPLASRHAQRLSPEEKWCNEFAANLLMPKDEIRQYVGEGQGGIAGRIANGHSIFGVSQDSFLSRTAEVLGWIIFELLRGPGLHKVGRRFMPRQLDRTTAAQMIDGIVSETRDGVSYLQNRHVIRGIEAHSIQIGDTPLTAKYLICLATSEGVATKGP